MLRLLVLAAVPLALLAGCGEDDGGTIAEGTGYALEVPDGWNNRSDEAEEFSAAGFEPDVVVSDEAEDGFAANINVLRQDGLADGTDVEQLTRESRQALQDPAVLEQLGGGLSPEDISEVRELELDGEPARSFDYSSERESRELRFRQIYVVRDGAGYVITYTGPAAGFRQGVSSLDEVVESWSWE